MNKKTNYIMKYGDEIARFLYAQENNVSMLGPMNCNTEKCRREWFLKMFNGPRENLKWISLN